MKYKTLTTININSEHICCSISQKKGEFGVDLKKEWLKERMKDGLVFTKLDERGKVFIEYIPAEKAYVPIKANNYMYINCFWVSGKFKGNGFATELLDGCIKDAKEKGKSGLVVLSSKTKKPFLSDPKFLKYKGFKVCDKSEPFFELLYLPFEESEVPSFYENAKFGKLKSNKNVLYYTNQCPHTDKYTKLIKKIAFENKFELEVINLNTLKLAKSAPCPFTTYSLYLNGIFVTNETLTEKKFLELIKNFK